MQGRWLKLLFGVIAAIASAFAALILFVGGPTPPPADQPQTFGWIGDQAQIDAAEAADPSTQFRDTPAGQAIMGDDEPVFLWRYVRIAAGKSATEDWYPNVNQGREGWCVGAATKHGIDVLTAVQITKDGQNAEWKPTSGEAVYGGSRVQIGNQRSGEGSLGRWAKDWLLQYGSISMEQHGQHDLREASPDRAALWGRTGVPSDLIPIAKKSPIRSAAMVTSFAELDRAIRQGYPGNLCSLQGFTMTRDGEGFGSPKGSWPHSMAAIGTRGGKRPGIFILNSWGDRAHTGPRWPPDAPVAGFWADAAVVDRMLQQRDSFVYSDAVGFPKRQLDWFVKNEAPNKPQPKKEHVYAAIRPAQNPNR